MDFADLEIFRAVAAETSVTRAAGQLNRAQSNVTTRVRQLEQALGAQLFLRAGKRMTLTEQGRQFLTYANQLLALAEEARQSMQPATPSGALRVGSMESTAASRLPRTLAHFHGRWPEVDLRITTGTTRALAGAVLARELDCALLAQSDAWPLDPGLQSTRVGSEELLLILPATHPVVRKPQDVMVGTLASFSSGCTYRDIAQTWLDSGGARRTRKVLEVASYHAILACVAAGTCAGVLPRSVLELQCDVPELRIHPLTSVDTLLVRRAAYSTPAYEAFAGVLSEQAW